MVCPYCAGCFCFTRVLLWGVRFLGPWVVMSLFGFLLRRADLADQERAGAPQAAEPAVQGHIHHEHIRQGYRQGKTKRETRGFFDRVPGTTVSVKFHGCREGTSFSV